MQTGKPICRYKQRKADCRISPRLLVERSMVVGFRPPKINGYCRFPPGLNEDLFMQITLSMAGYS